MQERDKAGKAIIHVWTVPEELSSKP